MILPFNFFQEEGRTESTGRAQQQQDGTIRTCFTVLSITDMPTTASSCHIAAVRAHNGLVFIPLFNGDIEEHHIKPS